MRNIKTLNNSEEKELYNILNSVKVETFSFKKPIRSRGSLIVKARGSIFGGTRRIKDSKKSKKMKIAKF